MVATLLYSTMPYCTAASGPRLGRLVTLRLRAHSQGCVSTTSTSQLPMSQCSMFQCPKMLHVPMSCFLLSLHLSSLDTLLANLHILEFSCTNTLVSAASCAVLFSALWKFDSGDPMMHHTCTIGFVEYMLQCSEAAYQSGPWWWVNGHNNTYYNVHKTIYRNGHGRYEGMREIYDGSLWERWHNTSWFLMLRQ